MSIDAAEQFGGEEGTAPQPGMGEWIPPVEIARIVVFLSRGDCRHLSGATSTSTAPATCDNRLWVRLT